MKTTVSFLWKKYDDLLGQYNRVAEKLSHQSSIIEGLKNDIHESRKTANETAKQAEELSQYIRRDCLEIAGIAPNEELTCEGIVRSVGNGIGMAVSDTNISVTHPIPSFNAAAPPKLIVKSTRREVRDRFYSNRKNLQENRSRTSLVSDLAMVVCTYLNHSRPAEIYMDAKWLNFPSLKTIFYLSNIKPKFPQIIIAKTISHPSDIKRKFSTILLAF